MKPRLIDYLDALHRERQLVLHGHQPTTLHYFCKLLETQVHDAALRAHATNAAIAAQLTPPTDAQFLAKCERVAAAQRARGCM